MEWSGARRYWEKWASNNVGSSGEPLKAALLINYDPTGPSRLVSTIAEQEGLKADPIEISQFVSFVKRNNSKRRAFLSGQTSILSPQFMRVGSAQGASTVQSMLEKVLL